MTLSYKEREILQKNVQMFIEKMPVQNRKIADNGVLSLFNKLKINDK
jgi:hypothetical protein